MEIVYIPGAPFGEFYYSPSSCKGVAIHEKIPAVVITMKSEFNPFEQPNIRVYDVNEHDFSKLIDAGNKRSTVDALAIACQRFPKAEIPFLDDILLGICNWCQWELIPGKPFYATKLGGMFDKMECMEAYKHEHELNDNQMEFERRIFPLKNYHL